jgi:HK97 family phage major capsid protein
VSTALQDLSHKQNNTFHLFREYLDQELGEIRTAVGELKKDDRLSGEAKQTIERMQNALNEQSQAIKDLQIALNRPITVSLEDPKAAQAEASKSAFNHALKAGMGKLTPEERKFVKFDEEGGIQTKALYQADGTTGGFLAVPEYVDQLIKAIVLISPVRDICDVRETSAPYIMIPKRTQTASAYRIAEQATRTESQNPKFGLVQVFPYEAAALALVSRTDLDDSSLDLGQFIMDEFAEQFAKLEGAEFINGDGNAKAFGFMADPSVTQQTNNPTTQTSGKIDYQTMVTLMHALKTGYRQGATWLFTTETLGAIRALTDANGRPLWQPFGTNDLPNQLWGYPYAEMPDMPQIAPGSQPIAFGNFKKGYQVVIRKQVSVQTLNERYADQNMIGYLGYYRYGGNVKLAEAIKVLTVHA